MGRRPLHLVFAFCSAALSHSSRPRASLNKDDNIQTISITRNWVGADKKACSMNIQALKYDSHTTYCIKKPKRTSVHHHDTLTGASVDPSFFFGVVQRPSNKHLLHPPPLLQQTSRQPGCTKCQIFDLIISKQKIEFPNDKL